MVLKAKLVFCFGPDLGLKWKTWAKLNKNPQTIVRELILYLTGRISKLGARRKTEDKDSAPLITNQQLSEASLQPTLQAVAPQLDRIREVISPHTADQSQTVHIRHFLNNPPTRGRGRRRRGGTQGGHAGNSNAKANRIWKCDYCICSCYPKWQPCECACSTHNKENCPHPNPSKVEAHKKSQRQKKPKTSTYQQTNRPTDAAGELGSQVFQTDKDLKCDHGTCEQPLGWKPCDRDCFTHREEDCPHPDPAKSGPHEKRKAEPQQNRAWDISPVRLFQIHPANTNPLHGTSDLQTSTLLSDAIEDEEKKTRMKPNMRVSESTIDPCNKPISLATGKPQKTTHTEST